jgi:hypothetical protein
MVRVLQDRYSLLPRAGGKDAEGAKDAEAQKLPDAEQVGFAW